MRTFILSMRTSAILLTCIGAMTLAAAMDWRIASLAATSLAAAVFIFTAVSENYRLDRGGTTATAASAAVTAGCINAQLIGAVYGWGGLSMLAVYLFSGLYWRHGWQYGSGMILIAIGLYVYASNIAAPSSPLATLRARAISALLALVHGLAAAFALAILVASGKLATTKGDWAANHIFVAGGLAIVVISLLAYATYRKLAR